MDLVLERADEFITVSKILSNICEEGFFKIDESGLRFRSMDPSRVALVDLEIPEQDFHHFESEREELFLGFPMARFYKMIKRGKKKDRIGFQANEEASKIEIEFVNNNRSKKFKLPLRDVEEEMEEMPAINHEASVSIESRILYESVRDIDLVSGSLTIGTGSDGSFELFGGGNGQGVRTILRDDDAALLDHNGEESRSSFGLGFIEDFINPIGKTEFIDLRLGEDMPLLAVYEFYDYSELRFVCAPRIESDEA